MDLILKPSGGQNIVLRPQARPAWQPEATVDAHTVELYKQEVDPATGSYLGGPILIGRFAPEGKVAVRHNPDTDRDVILYALPYSASGAAGFPEVRQATQAYVLFRRETDASVIGLTSNVTVDTAEIGITGFTRFARFRRLRVWADSGMTTMLREVLLDSDSYGSHELPRYFTLMREAAALTVEPSGGALTTEAGGDLGAETEGSSLPDAVYVTVAHSGGNSWTPESNVLQVTFASGDGTTSGSTGSFDPKPRDETNLNVL